MAWHCCWTAMFVCLSAFFIFLFVTPIVPSLQGGLTPIHVAAFCNSDFAIPALHEAGASVGARTLVCSDSDYMELIGKKDEHGVVCSTFCSISSSLALWSAVLCVILFVLCSAGSLLPIVVHFLLGNWVCVCVSHVLCVFIVYEDCSSYCRTAWPFLSLGSSAACWRWPYCSHWGEGIFIQVASDVWAQGSQDDWCV